MLVFRPDRNTSGKRDYSGAFLPESRAFIRYHRRAGRVVFEIEVDISQGAGGRRREVLNAIADYGGSHTIDALAFFGHGWPSGSQFGFTLANVALLATALREVNPTNFAVVVFYGCLMGAGPAMGDGNLADVTRDALCSAGFDHCRVSGHASAGNVPGIGGHTTMNPYCRRFEGGGSPTGGHGGTWLVRPGSELWPRFVRLMRTGFRYRFPWLAIEKIHKELTT